MANNNQKRAATAPYNFVSLPEKVLASEIENVDTFKNHICERGKISGEIELEIETLTPMFLGGNGETSFSPAGKFIIPGSSFRGMFKNIFKIVTCGAFRGRTSSQKKGEDFNDEHIYYRCLMGVGSMEWTKDLNAEYSRRMTGRTRGKNGKTVIVKKALPGFLIRTKDNKYLIAPLDEGCYEGRISIKDKKFFGLKDSCVVWDGVAAYIFTGTGDKKKFVRYTEITDINPNRQSWSELPDDVKESYEHDRNRRGVNLLDNEKILNREQIKELSRSFPAKLKAALTKAFEDVATLIPCHYLDEGGKVTAFGHGQYFRIPYRNSIGDIVPKNLQSEKIIDFADAIFGSKENWASRVAFEDAAPISEIKTLETAAAHPLMQPNTTSYQLYLKQGGEILTHWDKIGAEIRGYKIYWHNDNEDWKANDSEKRLDAGKTADKRITKDLTPLEKGSKFKSKIRFQNLSAVELGALLMIFDLNGVKNPAYKIGMGKPLGFGSVKITPQLYIENSDAYTGEIFDSEGFKSPCKASDTQTYIKAFKNYVDAQIGLKSWQKVMDELNAVLDWKNKPDSKKIAPMGNVSNGSTMDLDEKLKQRAVLPNIFEVLK